MGVLGLEKPVAMKPSSFALSMKAWLTTATYSLSAQMELKLYVPKLTRNPTCCCLLPTAYCVLVLSSPSRNPFTQGGLYIMT